MRLQREQTKIDRMLLGAFGGAAYVIGGNVRDHLFNQIHGTAHASKDVDYVITGLPVEHVRERLERMGRLDVVGASFAVMKLTVDGETVDVALPRRELSTGTGHRDFQVDFGPEVTIREDMQRRDFTMNGISYRLIDGSLLHVHGALDHIRGKTLTMINPSAFKEDPLRMWRAAQFAGRFGMEIATDTRRQLEIDAPLAATVAPERITEEITKLLVKSPKPSIGIEVARTTGLLQHAIPELLEGVGVTQNKWHAFNVYRHNLEACDQSKPDLISRLSALTHDIGKPRTAALRPDGEGHTFYDHDHVGGEIVQTRLVALHFPSAVVQGVSGLVDQHMYDADPTLSDAAIRRFIRRVGEDNVQRQFDLRRADVLGCGVPKYQSMEKNEAFEARVLQIQMEEPALDVRSLRIKGTDIIKLAVEQGVRDVAYRGDKLIGNVLEHLLEEVTDDPKLNAPDALLKRASELTRKLDDPKPTALAL